MKKRFGIIGKILMMIAVTGLFVGSVIISAGAMMIYDSTEQGIRTEISMAARTMNNLYDAFYDGDIDYDGEVCRIGDREFTDSDFAFITDCISCEEDVDFTLFYGDTRIFTSVKNKDGTLAVGTTAAEDVVNHVLKNGADYLSSKVMVNEQYYLGYYIPIHSHTGGVIGMLFAGKPIESASANAVQAVVHFLILAIITLVISVGGCMFVIRTIVKDIDNIKGYLAKLADGNFSVKLSGKTLKRKDELGELAQYSFKLRENLRDMVERDPLTGLFNRRSCHKKLDSLQSKKIGFAVVMGDIDFFKKINDTYGHAAGDHVLKNVSERLKECAVVNGGFAVRWGGEEFLLIFPRCDTEQIRPVIEGFLDDIRAMKLEHEGREITITMTFGISATLDGSQAEKAIGEADSLLYLGKNNGRNRIVMGQPINDQ